MTLVNPTLWQLWSEIVHNSDSLSDPVLIDIFTGGNNHRIFDNIRDEDLKSVLSKIKSLLNEPKNREKGAVIFKQLISTVDSKRLVGLQDTLLTCLRLICNDKFLHSHIIQDTLATFLPKCKNLPDILKELTPKNAYISKIVASCIEELQSSSSDGIKKIMRQPSGQVLKLLQVCLQYFRGTCGNFREKLEKVLLPYLDHDNVELVGIICNILPLLSQIGGGGSRGDNHSQDWLNMVQKLIKEAYNCIYLLYSDCSAIDDENPFEKTNNSTTEPLLSPIEDKKVFVRVSKTKKRLLNLIQAIGLYLRKSFPSHKPVPSGSLLKLLSFLISVNPIEILAKQGQGSSRKELLFLVALLPSIHSSAFKLLDGIVICLGTNILPQAIVVEQLFSQQWHWIAKNNNSKNLFIDLKQSMYSSLYHWLEMTKGQVSNTKTIKAWVEYFSKEFQLEKETVELRILGSNKSKNKLLNSQASIISNIRASTLNCDGLNANNSFLEKNSEICAISLDILMKLLPSVEHTIHKKLYCSLLKTHVQVYQQGSYPGQYESTICRIKLNETLVELALNPNARSNISLGLIINLLKRASLDSVSKVSKFCMSSISTLERLVHPSSQSIEFPSTLHLIEHGSNVDQSSVILNNLLKNQAVSEQEIVDGIRQDMVETITVDTESQTEIPITENGIGEEEEQTTNKISLKEIMSKLQQLTEKVQELSSSNHHQQQNSAVFRQYTLSSSLDSLSGHSSRTQTLSQQQINNDSGVNKRKLFNDDADVSIITNGQTKKCKPCDSDQDQADLNSSIADITDNTIDRTEITVTTTTSEDVIEMCKDFVDVEALHALAV